MSEQLAWLVWLMLGFYAALGLVTTLIMLAGGFKRFDAEAGRAPLYVKLMWAPGVIALWPLMVLRLCGLQPVEDRS